MTIWFQFSSEFIFWLASIGCQSELLLYQQIGPLYSQIRPKIGYLISSRFGPISTSVSSIILRTLLIKLFLLCLFLYNYSRFHKIFTVNYTLIKLLVWYLPSKGWFSSYEVLPIPLISLLFLINCHKKLF